jgi:uncharacterized protein (TIGR03790 family)
LVTLDCPGTETISREVFDRTIHWPILRHVARQGLADQIRFLVLMRGVPLRVQGTTVSPEPSDAASVDSELTLLWYELHWPRRALPLAGAVLNPYFNADPELSGEGTFDPRRWPITLVTRLDGYTSADVRGLIQRAQTPRTPGLFAVDLRAMPQLPGDDSVLRRTAARLSSLGCAVSLEETTAVLSHLSDLSGYASWGSNDPHQTTRHLDLRFRPGAIACPLVSTSARTFVEPPLSWDYVGWEDRAHFYAGSPQSLAGDFVRMGVTGVSGNVWEPMFAGTAQPDIALPAYAAGHTLAEAFYQATPVLSWMGVVVGDPLARLAR